MTVGGLTLSSGSKLNFQLGAPNSSLTNPSTSDAVVVSNSSSFTANGGQFTINASAQPGFTTGTYHLVQYTGTLGGNFNNLSIANATTPVQNSTGSYFYSQLVNNNGGTTKYVDLAATNQLIWNGNVNGTWDVGATGTGNWKTSLGLAGVNYYNGMGVTFDDSLTANATVSIAAGAVTPDSVTFNNSTTNYKIQGTGAINGATSLVKNGTGSTTLTGANTYTGGTTVSAGKLLVDNVTGSGLGTGSVTVSSGATLGGGGIIALGSGKTLSLNAGSFFAIGDPPSSVAQTLTVDSSAGTGAITLNGEIDIKLFANSSGTPLTEASRLIFIGSVAPQLGATSKLVVTTSALTSTSFVAGDSWKLLDWGSVTPGGTGAFGNLSGATSSSADLPTLSSGLAWNISQLYTTGFISVVVVPEPDRLLLLGFALMSLLIRRNRRTRNDTSLND